PLSLHDALPILSVIITALVLLPYVASTSLLLSLATVTIRLIGADSGDTIEITLLADTTLPNPILISCKPKLVPPRMYALSFIYYKKNDSICKTQLFSSLL